MPTRRAAAAAAANKADAEASPSTLTKASRAAASAVKDEVDVVEDEVKTLVEKADDALATVAAHDPTRRPTKLPVWAQFPLAATLSFAMASLGYSLLGEMTKGELAKVSRSQDTWGEVAVLASWRLVELALGWFGQLDTFDVAAMDLLSHGPSLYLLTAFYELSPSTAILSLVVDMLSAAVPFYLLRPLAAVHDPKAKLANRELIDLTLQLYTSGLSAAIYTVTIVLSLRFLLPRFLIVYFRAIPTLTPAYSASFAGILPVAVVFGIAASNFIYAPFATTGKAKDDDKIGEFDPAAASLRETVEWNLLGYTAKTKVIVRRTAVAAFVTAVNTYLACSMTIYGVQPAGAAVYAFVWVMASVCSGIGLGLVDGE